MAYHQLGETFSETLSRADQALYLAKQDGRDRVELGFPKRR
jgi:PleD family two-component response regulator